MKIITIKSQINELKKELFELREMERAEVAAAYEVLSHYSREEVEAAWTYPHKYPELSDAIVTVYCRDAYDYASYHIQHQIECLENRRKIYVSLRPFTSAEEDHKLYWKYFHKEEYGVYSALYSWELDE